MARKLYIFSPTGRVKTAGDLPGEMGGWFYRQLPYLGDYQARLLGVGNYLGAKRVPSWLHCPCPRACSALRKVKREPV